MKKHGSTLGGSLLVAGLTIGAGMLALPVVTGEAGFIPALLLLVIYWIFSLLTSFMFLEVNLCFTQPVNFVTMAEKTLGRAGKVIAWSLYLLLLYALTAAYLAGSNFFIPGGFGPLVFLLLFGSLVAFSTKRADMVNRILMAGLISGYILLITFSAPMMQENLLEHQDFQVLLPAIPIVVTAFGFHILIPTLTNYLGRDVARIKKALFSGSALAFVFYVLFQVVMLGSLPLASLREANISGTSATTALAALHGNSTISLIALLFTFFAITTSFLGVSMSLRDFLADGLKMEKKKALLMIVTYLPPMAFVLFYPRAFLMALDFAGVFVALLLGIWPVLMVYRKRQKKMEGPYRLSGGGFTLLATLVVYSAVVIVGFIYS